MSPKALEPRKLSTQPMSRGSSNTPITPPLHQIPIAGRRDLSPMATIAASPPDQYGAVFSSTMDSRRNSLSSQGSQYFMGAIPPLSRHDSHDSQSTVGAPPSTYRDNGADTASRASRSRMDSQMSLASNAPDRQEHKKKGLSALSGLLRRKQNSVSVPAAPGQYSCS